MQLHPVITEQFICRFRATGDGLILALIVQLTAFNATMITAAESSHKERGQNEIQVLYLAANVLHSVVLDLKLSTAAEVLTWRLPRGEASEDYAGLTCSNDGMVLAHVARNTRRGALHARSTELVKLDIAARAIVPLAQAVPHALSWPVISPDGKWIAATVYQDGKDSLAIISRDSGQTRVIPYDRSASPHAWTADGKIVLLTTVDTSGKRWEAVEFYLEAQRFNKMRTGGRPIVHENPRRVAVLEDNYRVVLVVDGGSTPLARFTGFFKDLVQWIDGDRLLAIVGEGPIDRFSILEVSSGNSRTYRLPSSSEINGACVVA